VPSFILACLAYLGVALPGSTLGLLWPSMRLTLHEPVGALGPLLIFGTAASVLASAATGRMMARTRVAPLLAVGTALISLALAAEAQSPSLWVIGCGMMVFGAGFGALNSALNAYAAAHFGARDITWMHASYGLGATAGPLLVTALLADGLGWRGAFRVMAVVLCAVACVLALSGRAWQPPAGPPQPPARVKRRVRFKRPVRSWMPSAAVLSALAFTAIETGIESAAGIWGYLFLTVGYGLPPRVAGVVVSAYWAMMFAGRAVLGPVAQRLGASRVLAAAVAGVPLSAALMAVPGLAVIPVIGMLIIGLATAPIFPLLTLTTAQRRPTGQAAQTAQMIGLQVAASAIGSAVVPAGIGLVIGAVGATVLAPSLLVLGLALCALHVFMTRRAAGLCPGPAAASLASG
jgi:fucose permease